MAITVTSNLTNINSCDATTGWIGGATLETQELFVEGTGCLAADVDNVTSAFSYVLPSTGTGSSGDWSSRYIWIWALCLTAPYLDVQSNGGIRIRAYCSTTGGISAGYADWYVAGSENYYGGWRCFTAGISYTPDATVGWNSTRVTRIGIVFKTTAKTKLALNCYWDYVRFGGGVTITGGTSSTLGAAGDFTQLYTADQSLDIGAIRREGGVYYIQGNFIIGDTGGNASYFRDESQILIWDGNRTGDSFHQINVVGGSGTNFFQLGDIAGSGSNAIGSKGIYIGTSAHLWTFTAAETDIDSFLLGANTFSEAGNIYLGTTTTKLGTSTSDLELVDNTFSSPALITRNLETSATTLNLLRNKITFATDTGSSLDLYDAYATDSSHWQIVGASATSGSGFKSTTAGTQSLTVSNHNFTQMDTPYITLETDETWNVINPTWTITNQTQLNFGGGTLSGASIDEKFTVDATIQQATGTKIQDARVKVIEVNPTPAIVNEASSDSNGLTSFSTLTRHIVGASSSALTITTHSTFSLKVYKYGYTPFAGAQTIASAVSPGVTLLTDLYKVQSTEATAADDGTQKVVIIESAADNQSHSIIKFTNGSGTLNVGNTVTGGTSGATGVVEQILEGDSTAGTIILKTRNSINFHTSTETLTESGGSTDWSGTFTANSEQRFYWLIQAGTIGGTARSLQELYDHFCAKLGEATLDTTDNWDDVILAGRSEWGNPIQGVALSTPNSFKTVRNEALSRGWCISGLNSLAGLSSFTDNAGTAFAPQVSITLSLTNVIVGSQCNIFQTGTVGNDLLGPMTASGSTVSTTYNWSGSINITIRVRNASSTPKYLPYEQTATLGSGVDFSLQVNQLTDTIAQ